MNILGVTAAAALALIAGAFAAAPRAELVTEVEIAAAPQEVWSLLGDASSHKSWNPFLVKMEGEMREGARLTNTMRPAGGNEMTFRPIVLKAEPERELRWLGRFLLPRIFDGEHYFLLQKTESGTRLIHGEKFRGIALWFIDVETFRSDFVAMNAALKKRVEQGA
jgi:hypothetical protein